MHNLSENTTLPNQLQHSLFSFSATNNNTKVHRKTQQSTCNKQSRFMQNYQNTPRVSTLQKQSRIQSLTFSQLSQPKTVQKSRKVQQNLNNNKSVPKIQQWIPINTANPEISHTSQQTTTSIQQYHHNQSIN